MLDLTFIRKYPERVKKAVRDKGESADVDRLLRLDEERRNLLSQVEALRHKRHLISEEIGHRTRKERNASGKMEEMRSIARELKGHTERLRAIEAERNKVWMRIPNIPNVSVPLGAGKEDNVFVRNWGEIPNPHFEPLPHWELCERLGLLDRVGGSKVAKAGFPLFRGAGARLGRALVAFMLDLHTQKHGYTEIQPPLLVNREAMTGTGQLPKREREMYRTDADDLFLIPTAEVPVTTMHRKEILSETDLPLRYVACTPCFRREAGSYGRATRGLMRVHQFDKVDLVKLVVPETSEHALETLIRDAEEVLQRLGLPYRVMASCVGELSFAAAESTTLEVWAMGAGTYLEVSSCSNFRDFQARRADIRYRPKDMPGTRFLHTVNGSGVALPRTMIALVENYQTADGSIVIPEALRDYMGGLERIERETR